MYECDHELSLDGLWLHGAGVDLFSNDFSFDVTAGGFEFGSHESVLSVVESLWSDGSTVSQDRADNAESTFSVLIEGEDLTALAAGEAALRRAFPAPGGSVDLVWRPGDNAPAAVRTVLAATMQFDSEGVEDESDRRQRVFQVTVTHAPFVRSEFETVVEALPAADAPTTTALDALSSATAPKWTAGWVGRSGTKSSSAIVGIVSTVSTATTPRSDSYYRFRWTGAADFVALPYIIIEHRVPGSKPTWPRPTITGRLNSTRTLEESEMGGSPIELLSTTVTPDGWTRSVFKASGSATNITWHSRVYYGVGVQTLTVQVRRLDQSSSPSSGARYTMLRTLEIGGTERTHGSLQIRTRSGVGGGLGNVVVHTSPDLGDGYSPDLLDGTLTYDEHVVDDTAPAGAWYSLGPGWMLKTKVSSARFTPGSYMLMAWTKRPTAGLATVSAAVYSTASPASSLAHLAGTTRAATYAVGEKRAMELGTVTLPGIASRVGEVQIELSSSQGIDIGGLWAFRLGRGCRLSNIVSDQSHMWLQSETAARRRSVVIGNTSDESLGWHPGTGSIRSLASHEFYPGPMSTYVIAGGAQDPAVSYRYFKRHHSHPADDGSQP